MAEMSDYFSDRENGPRARLEQTVSHTAWAGLVALINSLVSRGAFGLRFPSVCRDGNAVCGNDDSALGAAVSAEIEGLAWPLLTERREPGEFWAPAQPYLPATLQVLDLLEFVWRNVAEPSTVGPYHSYHSHFHLAFDQPTGRDQFRSDVNRILARTGLAYEMNRDGRIYRLAAPVLAEALANAIFRTGDSTLDVMLEESRTKFYSPDPLVRREALERLFDSWERLKTLADKRVSIGKILDCTSNEPVFRSVLEIEAKALTDIGNSHLFRHHERSQVPVIDVAHIDYLFHRLFALIQLVMQKHTAR